MKQRIVLFGMVAVALIFAACIGDGGNNSVETEGDSSSSAETYSSSGQLYSSSVVKFSSSFAGISSPSVVASSSSVKVQSSSSVVVCTNTYGTNTVTDCRNGQTYKTVVIGTQTWMAENLNYKASDSWCQNNSGDSCSKYGRLYIWAAAIAEKDYETVISCGNNRQGACPGGWHIPSDSEWTTLADFAGGKGIAGARLRSTEGWPTEWNDDIPGTDMYGFSALPAGDSHSKPGHSTFFWGSTGYLPDPATGGILNTGYASVKILDYNFAKIGFGYDRKDASYSVRCVKN